MWFEKCSVQFSDTIFTVSQNGRQYPVHVSKPLQANQAPVLEFPTHLLVVISPGVPRPKDAHLVENLKKVLAQGWLVSVNRSDGSFTPYSTGNSLAFALSASNSEPMTAAQAKLAAQTAYETLERFPGHRLLLIDAAGKHGIPAPDSLELDAKTHMKTYIADGGDLKMVYRDQSWGGYTRGPSPAGCDYVSKRVRFVEEGVLHEVKLASAIKDVLRDARYNFDLSFEIPVSQVDPAKSITVTMPNASGLIIENSELYTVAEQIVNGRTIVSRTTPPQKLIIKEN